MIRLHLPIEYLVKCGRLFQILGGIMKGRPFFNMGGIKNTLGTVVFPAWIKKIENNYLSIIIITSLRLRKPGVVGSL